MLRLIPNNENSCSHVGYAIRNLLRNFFRQKLTLALLITAMFLGGAIDAIYAKQPTVFTHEIQPLDFVEGVVPEPIDLQAIQLEDQRREEEGAPYRFAIPRTVLITPGVNGTWEEIDDETWLWRIRITSPEVQSLNLGFTQYHMPSGGRLFIYAADHSQVIGPFTEHDNEEHGQLWTPLVQSDDIVVELTIPVSEVPELELELGFINLGYRGLKPLITDKGAGDSGWCNVNVICPEGDSWRDQIRSVAMYTVSGIYQCTGTLINNTAQDDKPYFLSADHCGVDSGTASSMVIYWNYEASTCSGTTGSLDDSQTGAIFRAAYTTSDFVLVELDDMPSPAFNVYYAGWDRISSTPSSGVAIHHPSGDLKKISFENQSLSITSHGGYSSPGDGTHLRVADWDIGTTEGGSSGCPIFNPDKRVVGNLHGGLAACGNNESDWFGRFYKSWTGGEANSTRLSNWLDPLSTSITAISGKNPGFDEGDAYEPDNTAGEANEILPDSPQTHSIAPVGDVDYVRFSLDSESEVVIETSGLSGDTQMWLYDDQENQIDYDDDGGTGLFSRIERTTCGIDALSAGTYYVKVAEYGNNAKIDSYEIILTVTPCLEAPFLHSEPNITPGLCNMISWDVVPEANEYYAECSSDPCFSIVDSNSGWIADTSYEFCGLTSGETYWYRVKAGSSGIESAWSNVVSSRQCGTPGDFEPDCDVDWDDLNFFVFHWLDTDCNDAAGNETDWCYGTDIDQDSNVGFCDFAMLANYWLEGISEPFYEDFNDGLPVDGWDYYSSDGGGRIQVVNGRLRMDRDPSGTYTLNEAVLHLDLEGQSNVVLVFFQAESGDEVHSLPATFTGHENGDGVSVSNDGITWYQVVNASELDVGTGGQIFTVNLDDVGIAYTSDFRIKFQQYDNYPWSSDGREFDNIEVTFGGG